MVDSQHFAIFLPAIAGPPYYPKAYLMPLDPYQPCPCGIDKKVKFCCGGDIVAELNKIEELIAGEQRLAALDHINRLLAQKADRGCLLMHKARVQMELQEIDQARESVNQLLTVLPSNPAGLGMLAILEAAKGDTVEAIDTLQSALEVCQGRLPPQVYSGIGIVGRMLASRGELLAARGHLLFQVGVTGGKDQRAIQALLELDGSGHLPLPVLGLEQLSLADANGRLSAAGIAEFNEARLSAGKGCWLSAADKLDVLAEREPYEPAVWKNIGILRSWLAQSEKARVALHRYSSFASIPRDDAVEIESVVQFLTGLTEEDLIPEVTTTFILSDPQAVQEQLLSNKRLQTMEVDKEDFQESEEVPPLSAFLLLDREVPATGVGITREQIPLIQGEVLLFGKQTDRAARIEFSALKTQDFDAKIASLRGVLGNFATAPEKEEVTGRMTRFGSALQAPWRLPDDTPAETRQRLVEEHRADVLLKVWPELPLGVLDGKTMRQVAGDASMQTRVLAAILLSDMSEPLELTEYNQLRKSLGLPTLETLDPAGMRVQSLSPVKLTRLDVKKLSDDDLLAVYQRAILYSAGRVLQKVGPEIVSRPSLEKTVDKADVFELLSKIAPTQDEQLAYVIKAQEAATAAGESPARYLMAEIPLRLQRREVDEFRRVFERLSTKHIREQGVAESLQLLLYKLGILRPDGTMATGGPAAPAGGAAAPAPSGLWTPDQGSPAPASGGKSKLIIPGM